MTEKFTHGLYDPSFEHDSCGFGLIANIDDEPSHWLVKTAISALTRLTHRGAVAADGKTGDGCGLLIKTPDPFFRAVAGGVLDGPTVCRMFNSIIGGSQSPRYLSSDNDPLFLFGQWNANLRILEVTEVKTVPYVPLSHPFVERLIGTIRREYLDQVPFWSARDLQRKLLLYKDYYNRDRVHRGLDDVPPDEQRGINNRKVARLDEYRWEERCRGLYQLSEAA